MSSNLRITATLSAKNCTDFTMPIMMGRSDGTRKSTQFLIMTPNGEIGVSGTFDEILDFAASIMSQMFSWPIVNGKQDWFGEDDMQVIGKAVSDVRQQNGSAVRSEDRGSPSGEREG